MARKPSVSYWSSRKAYGCWYHGVQHILAIGPDDAPAGPTYVAALKQFTAILQTQNAANAKDDNTVRVVLESYLQFLHSSGKRKASTIRIRTRRYADFCGVHGELPIKKLTHYIVYQFCDQKRQGVNLKTKWHRPWTDGNVLLFLKVLSVAFNWAAKSGLISKNPLIGIEMPRARSRGREAVLTIEQIAVVLAACSPPFRDLVMVLAKTGARPGELAAATASAFRADLGAFVYHTEASRGKEEFSHKTAGEEKCRTIFLTGDALQIVKSLMKQYPAGPLFRTRAGRSWTEHSISRRFYKLAKVLGIRGLSAYSFRHTFATRWLQAGGSIDVLAELMGNTPEVIRKHYSHLCADQLGLRAKLEAFMSAEAGTQTPHLRVVGE